MKDFHITLQDSLVNAVTFHKGISKSEIVLPVENLSRVFIIKIIGKNETKRTKIGFSTIENAIHKTNVVGVKIIAINSTTIM